MVHMDFKIYKYVAYRYAAGKENTCQEGMNRSLTIPGCCNDMADLFPGQQVHGRNA